MKNKYLLFLLLSIFIGLVTVRAYSVSDFVNVANNGDSTKALIEQLKSFPLGTHDDIIDAMSYAYSELRDKQDSSNLYTTGVTRKQRRPWNLWVSHKG